MEGCLEEQSQEDLQRVTWGGEQRTPWPGGLKSEGLAVAVGQGAAVLSMSSWQNSTLPKAGLQHSPSRGFCWLCGPWSGLPSLGAPLFRPGGATWSSALGSEPGWPGSGCSWDYMQDP